MALKRDGWGKWRDEKGNVVDSEGRGKEMAKKGTPLNKKGPKKPTGGKQGGGKGSGKKK